MRVMQAEEIVREFRPPRPPGETSSYSEVENDLKNQTREEYYKLRNTWVRFGKMVGWVAHVYRDGECTVHFPAHNTSCLLRWQNLVPLNVKYENNEQVHALSKEI